MNKDYLALIENITHILILMEILAGLGIWIYYGVKNKSKRDYSIAPILFLVHALIFIILSSFNLITRDVYIIWRDLVFLHALTIFFTIGILEIKTIGGK